MATANDVSGKQMTNDPETPTVELWVDRLVFDANVSPGHRKVKGTSLGAETLVAEMATGLTDEELLRKHPELTAEDVTALRHYARFPEAFRLTFGAWEDEAEELDKFLEWNRQRRKIRRKEIEP